MGAMRTYRAIAAPLARLTLLVAIAFVLVLVILPLVLGAQGATLSIL